MQLRISENYHVEKCIYRSGEISLFLAKNILSQEQIIVQQLSAKHEKIFMFEYEKLQQIRQKNMLNIVSLEAFPDQLIAVWRYVSHTSLKQFCDSPQILPEKINVTLQILRGVNTILQHQLFCGKLHPQNIIYTKQKNVTLFYFGLFTPFPQQENYMPYENPQRSIYHALGVLIHQVMCQHCSTGNVQSIKQDFQSLSYTSQHERILYDTLGEFVKQCTENCQVNFCSTIEFLQDTLDIVMRQHQESEKKTLPLKYQGKKRIGKHILENVIGQGASGIVYKAWDEKLRRDVAIKVLHQSTKRYIVRFKREADVISRLNHPNIVKLYEINLNPPIHFSMQYISGISIQDYITLNKLSCHKIAEIFVQVLSAIEYAHNHKVIHRDLKPSNILIDEKGCAFIMDFGIAKIEDSYQVTKTGELVGTLHYMSPEQAKMAKSIDLRSDIYSVGIILYQVLSGELPFVGNTPIQVMHQIATKTPKSPEKFKKKVPVVFAKICMKAIEKDYEDRYQTAQEMCTDLQYFIDGNYSKIKVSRSKLRYLDILRIIAVCLLVTCATFFLLPKEPESPALFFHAQSEKYLAEKYSVAHDEDKNVIGQRLISLKVKLKKYKEAIEIYQQIFQANLAHTTVLEVAKAYYFLGKSDTALSLLKSCSANNVLGETFYYQGLIFYEKKQFPTAKQFFKKAINLNTNKELIPQMQLYLGICNVKMNLLREARKQLNIAQKSMAQDIRVWKYLGKSYLPQHFEEQGSQQDFQFAYDCFSKCIELDSSTSEYYTLAAQSCVHLQKYYEAHHLVKIALSKNPGDIEALNTSLYLSYREPFLQYAGFVLQSQSVANLTKVNEPDLFGGYFKELEKIYREDFINRAVALQNKNNKTNLQTFLEPLTKPNLNTKVLESITKGLFSLRYQENLQLQLQEYYENTTVVAQKRLDKITFELKSFIANENRYATYYKVAHLYNKIKQGNIINNEQVDQEQAQKVFDEETKLAIRYATAKVMVYTGQWDFLHSTSQKTISNINKIIISCAFREAGYYQSMDLQNIFVISEKLQKKNQEFLLALSAKNIALYFSSLPQQQIESNVNVLKALLQQQNTLVQLCAASAAFSTLYNDEQIRITAEKILLKAMHSSSATLRAYSHYHFWNSYYAISNGKKYLEFLKQGIQDTNTQVNSCVMKYAWRFSEQMKILQDEMIELAERNMGNQVALQSIFNLVLIDPSHPKVLKFQNDERYPNFFRVYTFIISKYYLTIHNLGRNHKRLKENVKKLLNKSNKVVHFKKNDVKAFFYYATASYGFHPLKTINQETNPFIIANIIANLKLPKQSSMIMNMLLPSVTKRQKNAVLASYKDHSSQQVQRSILAVRIFLAAQKERNQIYENVKNASAAEKIAAAEGFYSVISNDAFSYTRSTQGMQNFLEEANYDIYLQSFYRLLKEVFTNNYNKFLEYKRYLQYALELNPNKSKYFYEMALIHDVEDNIPMMIKRLEIAVDINPKSSRYKHLLAQMLYETNGDRAQILSLLLSAQQNTAYTPFLRDIADLYMKLKMWDRAQNVLQQTFLQDPLSVHHAVDLARVYIQQSRYQQAKQHLHTLMDIEKRLALNSPEYKPYINESFLKEDSILRHIYGKQGNDMSDSFFDGLLPETKEQDYFGHFSPGATIDRYKIISSLGVGGMGIVFKAKDIHTQQDVAIKVVLQNRLTSLSKKRFLQEVEVSGQLDHRNIIKVIKAGAFNEHIFLVMEYVAGLSLDEYCEKNNLTIEDKLHLFAQICAAMGHAHKRKVIHRDLKPENIMVTADGQIKVMDFGLAKLTEIKKFQLTKSQEIMGSPRYMSPEQAKGDRNVDARTDVYALGAILYEMLTGEKMMPGDTLMEILYNIQRQNYPKHLVIAGENTPKDIELLWKKSVGKKNSRYKNAGEVSEALQQYLQLGNSSFMQLAIQRYTLGVRELLILSIIAVTVAIYMVFSQIPQTKETIRLSKNLDTLQSLVERKLFDAAHELTIILRNNPKIDQQKLQLLTLQVQNAKGLHYEVYNTVKSLEDEQITPLVALEQINALIHMHKYELCSKYFPYLQDRNGKLKDIDAKYQNKVWSSQLIVHFYQGKYREVLETYKKMTVVDKKLNVFLGCSYLEIYNLIVTCEKKIYDLQKTSKLPLRKSKKRDLFAEINQQREMCKQLLASGVQNVTEEKVASQGTKTVVLTNAYNIFKSVKEDQRNVLFYEGFAKTNIFLHEETNVRTYLANAQRYLEQATKMRPQHYDYLILLGQVYSKRKLYQKAYFAFEKAIAISNNNVKAIDAIMQLPLEDARYQEQIFWSIFKSFGINFKTPKPDLLHEDIENIKLQNVHHYEAWRSNHNNQTDIKQICEAFLSSTDYAQELAMEMLVLKSYSYPLHKVEEYIENIMQCLQQISPQKNTRDTKTYLYEKVYTARKKAVYYHLADFYLHHSELPTTADFKSDVQTLLLSRKEHILIRYLAAKMLVQKSDSLLLKHYNNRQDIELALVSSCVLVEEGLFVDLDIFLSQSMKLDTPEKTVLYTRLFRIDNKYYELFLKRYLPNYTRRELWRNLKIKMRKSSSLSKDIVAVAAVLWWQTPLMNPHNNAGEILQQAMQGNDKALAAYAHHFYWISPHVYNMAQKYRQQYYDYLENADSSCQLQMLNSNRFYSRMDDIHFFNALEKLAIEGSSAVRLKATYILAERQPYSKQFVRIVNHTSLSNAQRTLAYVSGVVGKLQVLIRDKNKHDIKILQNEISQVCELYDQLMLNRDNDAFKSFIYKVTAFLGLRSLIQLSRSECSPQLTANIIMNLCSDPMLPSSMLPFLTRFLGVAHDDDETLRKTLSDYEFSPSTNVIRSVSSAYSFLGEKTPRHDKHIWKSGFAWGKYRKLRQKLMLKETGFYERVHAASSSYYDLYLQKLTKNTLGKDKKPQQLQNYIQQLQIALKFAQEDVFRAKFNYELSILYHAMSNLVADKTKAQDFLNLAETHIQKSLEQVDLPLEYKMRYELQLAYIKSETSLATAHSAIEKYLPLTKNPTLLNVMLAALEGHSDKKTQYLYQEVLHKKLLCVAKFHFINDADSKKSYSEIKKTHLLLQKVSRYPDFHQTCHKILWTYLKLEND